MKLVLIQLPSPWLISDRDLPLLGILYLAAAQRAVGRDVQVCDLVGQPPEAWYIPEGDVYGLSFTTPQVPLAKKAIDLLRGRTKQKVRIIVGGPHASAMPEWCRDTLGADHVFVGEADWPLVSFMQMLEEGNEPTRIYRCPAPLLTNIPRPARDLVDIRSFHAMGINQYVANATYEGYLQTGRGCPFDCSFCAQAALSGRKARYYPIKKVLEDLDELLGRYECGLVYIEDDTFNLNKKRTIELCKEFEKRKFKWHCLCRADILTQEVADAMASAGCQNVTFGFESGSNRILEAMNKKETVEDARRAIDIVNRTGMGIRGQMIVGFPGEDDGTIAETEAFVREAAVTKWGFHTFVPLPGSSSWRLLKMPSNPPVEFFDRGFETIGKPGSWSGHHHPKAAEWLARLREVADEQNIDR